MSELPLGYREGANEQPALSEAGAARRDGILPMLERALAGRIRRRRLVRTGAGVAIVLLAGVGVMRLWPAPRPAPRTEQRLGAADQSPPVQESLVMRNASLRVVKTQPGPGSITVVDDEALLRELRALGRPTGLVRTGGRVILTSDIGLDEPGQGTD